MSLLELYNACKKGDVARIRKDVADGYDVRKVVDKYWFNDTPLHCACEYGHLPLVKYLIEDLKCSVFRTDTMGSTPLHKACLSGNLPLVKYLIEDLKCSTTFTNIAGDTPLHSACRRNHLAVVKFLTDEKNCDIEAVNEDGWTPLYWAIMEHCLEVVQFLTNGKHCNVEAVDKDGQTPLHWAAKRGGIAIATFLLQEAQCNPNCVARDGQTPLDMANEPELIRLLLSSGAKPTSCFPSHLRDNPTDMAINMFVLGNPGVGKSTFVKALSTEGQGFSRIKYQFTKVRDVDEKTAGIIPHDIHSKALGRLTLYDFAGHKEYYAGHDALLHNTMANYPSIVTLVVDMRDEEGKIRETLQYWFQFINNHSCEEGAKPLLMIIGSYADEVHSREAKQKSKVLESVVSGYDFKNVTFAGQIVIDCRYAESSSMTKIRLRLSQICHILRSSEEMAAAHHSFLVFLLDRFRDRLAVTVSDATEELGRQLNRDTHVYLECVKSSNPFEMCEKLNERGNVLFMKNKEHPGKSWIVLDKAVLLSQVIFAPEGFKEHQKSLSTSTGVVPLSKLAPLFPNLHCDVITQFLCHLEFCHEITDSEVLSFLIACHTKTQNERIFFFPGLVDLDVPTDVWQPNDQFYYHSGWLLQCSTPGQFLSPRFLQVLLLRLVYGLVATTPTYLSLDDYPSLERSLYVWKNGICWSDRLGIETIVEVEDQRYVTVMMRSLKPMISEIELISTRSRIINKILKTKKELCPTVTIHESVIHPEEATSYPLNIAKAKSISIAEISHAVVSAKVGVLDSSRQMVELESRLLLFEPYAGLGKEVLKQLFNEDNLKYHSEVDDEFFYRIADCVHDKTDYFVALFKPSATRLDNIVDQAPRGETHRLVRVFQLWREEMGGRGNILKPSQNIRPV